MTERARLSQAPEWMAAEMPPGYRTRLFEIQRLSEDLQAMDTMGRVLWETGPPLWDAVCALFGALECGVDVTAGNAGPIAVAIGEPRRLLVVVSSAAGPIQKTNGELTQAFQAVQFAGADDRVVLVTGNDPATAPADRPEAVLPDALAMLERMGVNVLTTAALFRVWRLSLEDRQKARRILDQLHAQDGGQFVVTR